MQILPLNEVHIPGNRQRREFDEGSLRELAQSIRDKGLMHAIVVRNDGHTLVAGERRILALRKITTPYEYDGAEVPPDCVPTVRLGELDPLRVEEAELEENTLRLDLTWKEKANAIARLHALRSAQANAAGTVQTPKNTVEELLGRMAKPGESTQIVTDSVLLNRHLDDPAIANAKSRKEALNLVKKKLRREQHAIAADAIKEIKSRHHVIHGSCLDVMIDLPDDTFDVICTDPPYGIGADKFAPLSGSHSGAQHEYEDDYESAFEVWQTILSEGFRVCKAEAHLYMFCDFTYYHALVDLATDEGWTVWDRPIIWHKPGGGMLGDSTRGPRKSYETILYARKGDKKVTGVFLDTVIVPQADTSSHSAAKPVKLITNLLGRSCVPGDSVLDPCAGSGTIFAAANVLSLFATGIEKDQNHYNTSITRLHGVD